MSWRRGHFIILPAVMLMSHFAFPAFQLGCGFMYELSNEMLSFLKVRLSGNLLSEPIAVRGNHYNNIMF